MLLLFLFYVNALKHKSERGHFLKKFFFVVRLVRTRDFSQFSSTAALVKSWYQRSSTYKNARLRVYFICHRLFNIKLSLFSANLNLANLTLP